MRYDFRFFYAAEVREILAEIPAARSVDEVIGPRAEPAGPDSRGAARALATI